AFAGGKLFVVWSGFEPPHLIHVLKLVVAEDGTVPPQVMTATPINDWTNDTTGPATAFHAPGNRPYVAFTGADDRLYVISSTDDGASFPNRVILPAELSRHDAGPAIAVHSDGTVCVCWPGTDGD
ncbi:MAG TPA: hypothetical protein VLF14_07520, partial [Candidatus Binatia bacterium]|nr:hypothetical protein [Candidatus Binatia bacterium]